MAVVSKESADRYRVSFAELAKVRRGEIVQVDPYLIAQAIAAVMHACTVRSASGRSLLWNEYRVILARKDFELVRSLQGPLEQDLQTVLAQQAHARQAELIGALRITIVFDEADELPLGQGVVRVAFVPTERLPQPRSGEMTVRFDSWAIAGEIAARSPTPPSDTMFVDDSADAARGRCVLQWSAGEAVLERGATVVLGRPHPEAPASFVSLAGASSKISKQHCWIAVGNTTARVGRFPNANPVHVNGQAVAAGQDIESVLPVEISLSRGDLVVSVRRR